MPLLSCTGKAQDIAGLGDGGIWGRARIGFTLVALGVTWSHLDSLGLTCELAFLRVFDKVACNGCAIGQKLD